MLSYVIGLLSFLFLRYAILMEILENYAGLLGEDIWLNDGLIMHYKERSCSERETDGVDLQNS
jgi:hypothetical protein